MIRAILCGVAFFLMACSEPTAEVPAPASEEEVPLAPSCSNAHNLDLTIDATFGITVQPPVLENVGHNDRVCWRVYNRSNETLNVEIADLAHEQFAKGYPDPPHQHHVDPLHDQGSGDRGEKLEQVPSNAGSDPPVEIRVRARRMQTYQGCYKYTVILFDTSGAEKGRCDPRLEYDDGGPIGPFGAGSPESRNLCEGRDALSPCQ